MKVIVLVRMALFSKWPFLRVYVKKPDMRSGGE